ncbi:LacI family DNA-binding transcriptional regulator [Arthrobacter sp. MYb213]|uniref:LacI family DNA-binding transcriptional regulator n=1 Tax=Arthrobacter sp. MYb213 TaxID=1848595 RepID=UPI000CFC9864|nr:LacI family DNA-binding transcriptional regulator [Arthrobacter sp. MYb213]PRB69341.1 LacI family transcriptional regulator [Arthrobacter sp. MYb213]
MATRDDVARLAGVSPSTVSYVISGRRKISDATKARVLAAMRELRYTPNAFAQGLAGARRGILALHFPTSVDGYSSTEFEYVTAAMERARMFGYHMLLWSNPMTDVMGLESLVAQKLVAGVLLMEVSISDPRFDVLRRAKIPFASIGRPDDNADVTYVDNDFAEAGRIAVEHLASLGHRSIMYINVSVEEQEAGNGPGIRTIRAIREAVEGRDMLLQEVPVENNARGGRAAWEAYLELRPRPTAVLGLKEFATAGFVNAAGMASWQIPKDLSVIALGVGDRSAEMVAPALTTVAPSGEHISHAAVEALVQLIEGRTQQVLQELITPVMIERESSGPVPE